MTNMEFYRDEIETIMDEGHCVAVTTNGVPVKCHISLYCNECMLDGGCRDNNLIKWLMSEHKVKPTITARERHFLEFVETGWLARDDDSALWWFEKRPEKRGTLWDEVCSYFHVGEIVKNIFPFIKWEDEEPWSVEELLKLEVKNED